MSSKLKTKIYKIQLDIRDIMIHITIVHEECFGKSGLYSIWCKDNKDAIYENDYIITYKCKYETVKELCDTSIDIIKPIENATKDLLKGTKELLKQVKILEKQLIIGNKKGKTKVEKDGIHKFLFLECGDNDTRYQSLLASVQGVGDVVNELA